MKPNEMWCSVVIVLSNGWRMQCGGWDEVWMKVYSDAASDSAVSSDAQPTRCKLPDVSYQIRSV